MAKKWKNSFWSIDKRIEKDTVLSLRMKPIISELTYVKKNCRSFLLHQYLKIFFYQNDKKIMGIISST